MRTRAFLAACAIAMLPAAAHAQGPGSFARFDNNNRGLIFLDLAYAPTDGCQAILTIRRGAPGQVAFAPRTVPVIATVGPDPRGCSGKPFARRISRVAGGLEPNLVSVFFVTPSGQLLKRENLSVGL